MDLRQSERSGCVRVAERRIRILPFLPFLLLTVTFGVRSLVQSRHLLVGDPDMAVTVTTTLRQRVKTVKTC